MDVLIDDILIHIFTWIDYPERFRLQCVSWRWRRIVDKHFANIGVVSMVDYIAMFRNISIQRGQLEPQFKKARISVLSFDTVESVNLAVYTIRAYAFLEAQVKKEKIVEGLIVTMFEFDFNGFNVLIKALIESTKVRYFVSLNIEKGSSSAGSTLTLALPVVNNVVLKLRSIEVKCVLSYYGSMIFY